MKENETMMNNAIQYINSIVITINPDINAAIPEKHWCQKGQNKIDDKSQDYVELINKLQHHTWCSTSYCICTKGGQQACRFGYPKDINDHTAIRENYHS